MIALYKSDPDRSLYLSNLSASNNNKIRDKTSPLYLSLSPKIKKNYLGRKISPYANNNFFTIKDKPSNHLPKLKNRPKVNLTVLQNYFIDFQNKSKFLLRQLEKNVFG
jgi:hypothetical protein